jgi:superfamily I DNA/RNA helicase
VRKGSLEFRWRNARKRIFNLIEKARRMNEEKLSSPGSPGGKSAAGAPESEPGGLPPVAKEVAQSAQGELDKLKRAAQEQGSAALQEAKAVTESALRQAREVGGDLLKEQKNYLAQKVDHYAQALRSAGERLRHEQDPLLAEPAQRVAEQLGSLANYLRQKEAADFLLDLETFTRRRPEIVLGALFVLGLGAARFLKASRSRARPPSSSDQGAGSSSTSESSLGTQSPPGAPPGPVEPTTIPPSAMP